MSLWPCTWSGCEKPAVRKAGDCLICNGHLCLTHMQLPWHTCPTPDDWQAYATQYAAAERRYLEDLCDRIDVAKLCTRASSLRNGIPCTTQLSPKHLSSMMGGQNCHAVITFEDKVSWLARFRLTWTMSPPKEVRDYILRSEVATMAYLQRYTSVPTPAIFDWACEADPENQVGVGFILMEKLAGAPLDWSSASAAEKDKVMEQLADIYLELEQHPFQAMGSLICSSVHATDIQVQGLADHTTFQANGEPLGPFSSSETGWRSIIKLYAEMIKRGEIYAPQLQDLYAAHLCRLKLVDDLWQNEPSRELFFLKHPDDKGDHILVNEAFDIIGVIDWEWTQTVSKAEAFCSPCMMWPDAEYYEGRNDLSEEEFRFARMFQHRGREDIANCILNGRRYQRFCSLLGIDASYDDGATFASLLQGMKSALGLDHIWQHFEEQAHETLEDAGLLDTKGIP